MKSLGFITTIPNVNVSNDEMKIVSFSTSLDGFSLSLCLSGVDRIVYDVFLIY